MLRARPHRAAPSRLIGRVNLISSVAMAFHGFNIVDGVVGVLVLVGILGGIRRGLSGELARVIAAGAALYIAWKFAEPLADWVMQKQPMTYTRGYAVAFVAIMAAALGLTWLIRAALRHVMEFAFKGKLERLGGGFCGLLRSAIVVCFLVLLVSLAPQGELRAAVCDDSVIGATICRHLRPVYDELRERTPDLPLPAPAEVPGMDQEELEADDALVEADPDFVVTDVEDEDVSTTNGHE
jgi:uncharacterized membrane protein required for colicin V production